MELKIKIKEVKEEWKPLCIGMRCIIYVAENCPWAIDDGDETEIILIDSGYVTNSIRYKDNSHYEGLFRTETIRDATPEEIIAWHCRCVLDICSKTECLGVFERIRHIPAGDEWIKAKELLEGKEVILELV